MTSAERDDHLIAAQKYHRYNYEQEMWIHLLVWAGWEDS